MGDILFFLNHCSPADRDRDGTVARNGRREEKKLQEKSGPGRDASGWRPKGNALCVATLCTVMRSDGKTRMVRTCTWTAA
jgi:hypothetical protein